MGKIIHISSYEDMAQIADKLQSKSEEYTGLYGDLYTEVENLKNVWEGKDNLAFTDQINGFQKDFQDMAAKLQEMCEILRLQSKNYKGQQEENTIAVRKLTN